MNFNDIIPIIFEQEGAYVFDPKDKGGETNYGISKRAYPTLDIKNITQDEAKDIYFKDYWVPCKAEKLPEDLRLIHFSTAVNTGINGAAKILQRAAQVTVDGAIGPITLKAVQSLNKERYCVYLMQKYTNIVINEHSQVKFLNGWIRRAIEMI